MIHSLKFAAVVTPENMATVTRLAADIWPPYFGPIIGLDQVQYMLDQMQSLTAIQQQIAAGADYYLLMCDNRVAGYVGFEVALGCLLLSKLYLAAEFRGRGLGRRTLEFIESCAIDADCDVVELRVNKRNHKALLAYKRWGFTSTGGDCLDIGAGYVMDDYCMTKRLRPAVC